MSDSNPSAPASASTIPPVPIDSDPTRFASVPALPLGPHDGAPLLQTVGDTLRLILNRPAEHNRLDPADIDVMQGLFADLARERAVRTLVITGTGERTFSSGYTLQAIISHLDARFENMLDTLETLPMTTIAAINGGLYGGATDLALCCDLRIGVSGTRMFMPAARFALHYYPGGVRRYVSRLGLTAAKKLFLTAMTIEQDEMLRIGFLTELVSRDQLGATVERYLQAMDQTDPKVVSQMKANLNSLADRNVDLEQMSKDYAESLRSDEIRLRMAKLLGSKG